MATEPPCLAGAPRLASALTRLPCFGLGTGRTSMAVFLVDWAAGFERARLAGLLLVETAIWLIYSSIQNLLPVKDPLRKCCIDSLLGDCESLISTIDLSKDTN